MDTYKLPGFTIETGGEAAPLEISEIKKAIDKNIEIPAIMMYYEYSAVTQTDAPAAPNTAAIPSDTSAA